jgi:hypothetical protein
MESADNNIKLLVGDGDKKKEQKKTVNMMKRILENVLKHPNEEKYRQIIKKVHQFTKDKTM